MIKRNKELTEIYYTYKDLVRNVSRSFKKKFPDDELDDLTQSCWEHIILKYPSYKDDKSKLSTWITLVCQTTLIDMHRANNAAKRGVNKSSVSIENLGALKEKFK